MNEKLFWAKIQQCQTETWILHPSARSHLQYFELIREQEMLSEEPRLMKTQGQSPLDLEATLASPHQPFGRLLWQPGRLRAESSLILRSPQPAPTVNRKDLVTEPPPTASFLPDPPPIPQFHYPPPPGLRFIRHTAARSDIPPTERGADRCQMRCHWSGSGGWGGFT